MFSNINKLVFVFCLVLMPVLIFAATPTSYENEALGVKISAPEGWFVTPGDKVQQTLNKGVDELKTLDSIKEAIKKVGVLVMFSQYEFGAPIEYNPNVALITEPISGGYIKSVNDYASASLMNIKTMFKDVLVIAEPKMVKLAGEDASHFIYEGSMVRGYLEIRVRSSVYLMIRDKLGYTLTCSDKAANFDNNKQLANQLGVTSIPRFVFFKEGKKVGEVVGAGYTANDILGKYNGFWSHAALQSKYQYKLFYTNQ